MIARMGDRHGDLVIRDLERSEVAGVWSIDRTEWIDRVYHVRDGELVLEAEHYDVRDWPPGEADEYGPRLLDCFDRGGSCLGAFDGDTLVGAVVLESRFIGRDADRLQLKFLHVSHDYRGSGLGATLFERAAARAEALGARALYISSSPSEKTVQFYFRRGCRPTPETDPELFALEPLDIHLELELLDRPRPDASARGA